MPVFSFSIFSILVEYLLQSYNFFSSFNFSLWENWVPNIFNVLLFRSIQRIPQTATWTLFKTPTPAISYFIKFGFNPKNYEKKSKVSTICFIEIIPFKKKVILSEEIRRNNTTKTKTNKKAEIGSPWQVAFPREK